MKNLKIAYLTLFLLVSNLVVAQSTVPGPNPPPPVGLPIDSILWVLGVVAIGFGVYMLKKRNVKSAH